MGKYKYLVWCAVVVLLAVAGYYLGLVGYVAPVSELIVWVFVVAGAFAIGEKIIARRFGPRPD